MQRTRGPSLWERRNTPPAKLPEPDSKVIAGRPRLSPDANPSNHRIDELDARLAWLHQIDTGLLTVTR